MRCLSIPCNNRREAERGRLPAGIVLAAAALLFTLQRASAQSSQPPSSPPASYSCILLSTSPFSWASAIKKEAIAGALPAETALPLKNSPVVWNITGDTITQNILPASGAYYDVRTIGVGAIAGSNSLGIGSPVEWLQNTANGVWSEQQLPLGEFLNGTVYGMDGGLEVGEAGDNSVLSKGPSHEYACMWYPDSSGKITIVTINSHLFSASCAYAVSGLNIVGTGSIAVSGENYTHAMALQMDSSYKKYYTLDLSKAVHLTYPNSCARSIDGTVVAGYGLDSQGVSHPLLWKVPNGFSSSKGHTVYQNLPLPIGLIGGSATSVRGLYAVGYGFTDAANAIHTSHALLWHWDGTAWAVQDLSAAMPAGSPPKGSAYTASLLNGVDSSGDAVGEVYDGAGNNYAALWSVRTLSLQASSPSSHSAPDSSTDSAPAPAPSRWSITKIIVLLGGGLLGIGLLVSGVKQIKRKL